MAQRIDALKKEVEEYCQKVVEVQKVTLHWAKKIQEVRAESHTN